MDNFKMPEMTEFDVTCHSAECENAGITIRVYASLNEPHVVCGPCGIQIEDVIPVANN